MVRFQFYFIVNFIYKRYWKRRKMKLGTLGVNVFAVCKLLKFDYNIFGIYGVFFKSIYDIIYTKDGVNVN